MSKRQSEIVRLRGEGKSERTIANELGLSRATVRHYLNQHQKGVRARSKRGKVYRRYGQRQARWQRAKDIVKRRNKYSPSPDGRRTYVSERWSARENRWKISAYKK